MNTTIEMLQAAYDAATDAYGDAEDEARAYERSTCFVNDDDPVFAATWMLAEAMEEAEAALRAAERAAALG